MSYIQVQDIRQGMDRKRKQRVVGELGTAWTIKNGHLTRGGDIDRRKKFVKQTGSFPATTSGLYSINETLYTVGYDSGEAVNIPPGVTHILTQHPTATIAIKEALDARGFDGKLYSIIEFVDGNIYHFYDTARVTDWDTIASDIRHFVHALSWRFVTQRFNLDLIVFSQVLDQKVHILFCRPTNYLVALIERHNCSYHHFRMCQHQHSDQQVSARC